MGAVGSINAVPLVDWLKGRASNLYTQFGEDGLIAGCFDRIGEASRHCFEIGAADGVFFSNTLRLRDQGWLAVLIEADEKLYSKLARDFGGQSTCLHRHVTDLDSVLTITDISRTPDLGVIDIDGQDWYLWDDLVLYRPRVMLVEIYPPDVEAGVPVRGQAGQAGLDKIEALGVSKGYQLVATTHCNALFVDRSALE